MTPERLPANHAVCDGRGKRKDGTYAGVPLRRQWGQSTRCAGVGRSGRSHSAAGWCGSAFSLKTCHRLTAPVYGSEDKCNGDGYGCSFSSDTLAALLAHHVGLRSLRSPNCKPSGWNTYTCEHGSTTWTVASKREEGVLRVAADSYWPDPRFALAKAGRPERAASRTPRACSVRLPKPGLQIGTRLTRQSADLGVAAALASIDAGVDIARPGLVESPPAMTALTQLVHVVPMFVHRELRRLDLQQPDERRLVLLLERDDVERRGSARCCRR